MEVKEILASYGVSVISNITHVTSQSGHSYISSSPNSSSRKLSPLPHQSINPTNTPPDNHDSLFLERLQHTSPQETQKSLPPYEINKPPPSSPTLVNRKDGTKKSTTKPTDYILGTKNPAN